MLCSELTKVRQVGQEFKAEPLYCRSWGCPVCAPRRQKELRGLAAKGSPSTFITLTVNPRWGGSPNERARRLVMAWRNIRQELKRRGIAAKLPFLAVFEKTRRGEPHLHIICRAPFISQRWLSDYMRSYMDAPIVDIRRVRTHRGVAVYISKYLSKDAHHFDGCKRYWRSRDWNIVDPDDEGPIGQVVEIIKRSFAEVQEDIRLVGTTSAETLNGGRVLVGWWTGQIRRWA